MNSWLFGLTPVSKTCHPKTQTAFAFPVRAYVLARDGWQVSHFPLGTAQQHCLYQLSRLSARFFSLSHLLIPDSSTNVLTAADRQRHAFYAKLLYAWQAKENRKTMKLPKRQKNYERYII